MDKLIVGENFKSCQLPKYVKPYWPLIKTCLNPQLERAYQTNSFHINSYLDISNAPSDIGKIYYLTIQESWVEPGDSQRRPGLHVDRPGAVKLKRGSSDHQLGLNHEGLGKSQRYDGHHWGNGCAHYVSQRPIGKKSYKYEDVYVETDEQLNEDHAQNPDEDSNMELNENPDEDPDENRDVDSDVDPDKDTNDNPDKGQDEDQNENPDENPVDVPDENPYENQDEEIADHKGSQDEESNDDPDEDLNEDPDKEPDKDSDEDPDEDSYEDPDEDTDEESDEDVPVYVMEGGIYIASSISDSCKAWNCSVEPEVIGHHGDIEHLRSVLPGEGEVLEPGQLYWITDKTPHESLQLKQRTYRQFFRIVTRDVSLWYKDHSTANPLGVEPDPDVTKIVIGNKFSEEGVEIVESSHETKQKRAKFLQ